MKIAIVCAPGVGDALIMHIASHQLKLAGFEVVTVTPHRFGKWLSGYEFGDWDDCDAIFLQHDNSSRSKEIHALNKPVYTFYGSHQLSKHGPLKEGFDFVCDHDKTMVENVIKSLETLFSIPATSDNGFTPPEGLVYRRNTKRVIIHATSGNHLRNWPLEKFNKVAEWLKAKGYEPVFLPVFPSLEELASFIYESAFFIGNHSGPGHIASCLHIPHIIIGTEERHMRHWRPGWKKGSVIVPPRWIPNVKGFRLREKKWKSLITKGMVIASVKKEFLIH